MTNKQLLPHTKLERITRNKHSTLFGPFVSYEENVVNKVPGAVNIYKI